VGAGPSVSARQRSSAREEHPGLVGAETAVATPACSSVQGAEDMVKGNWALFEEDFWSINQILQSLMRSASARSVMLIDKTGQLINSIGEPPGFDVTSFSSLAAADFAANAQLAEMVGESDFSTLVHQGTKESLFLQVIANRVILVVLFDRKTSLGLVRLKARRAGDDLLNVLQRLFDKLQYRNEETPAPTLGADFAAEAENEIDSLFRD
jgi:predicted regulator of Ras-like GTPase activity (Roadblock/LC7/MglB family)